MTLIQGQGRERRGKRTNCPAPVSRREQAQADETSEFSQICQGLLKLCSLRLRRLLFVFLLLSSDKTFVSTLSISTMQPNILLLFLFSTVQIRDKRLLLREIDLRVSVKVCPF